MAFSLEFQNFFSRSLEQFFLTVGQNNFGNKIPLLLYVKVSSDDSPFRFARVGDNYILQSDPEEQTFRVSKIVKHGNFKPLGSGKEGDGRHDIALVRHVLLH